MADIVVSERSRVVVSWAVFLAILALVATAVETRASVNEHGRRIAEIEKQAATGATKDDIERLEARVIRIESLLLSQRSPGR